MACPLLWLEEFVALACCAVAAIATARRLAAAAMPALLIRNRRREEEGVTGDAMAELSSVAGLMVELIDCPGEKQNGLDGAGARVPVVQRKQIAPIAISRVRDTALFLATV